MALNKYYIDYRDNSFKKNLDVSFLAPEVYYELIPDDTLKGLYTHIYLDGSGRFLSFSFTKEEIEEAFCGDFNEMLNRHCELHNFDPLHLVDKKMYISTEEFEGRVLPQIKGE